MKTLLFILLCLFSTLSIYSQGFGDDPENDNYHSKQSKKIADTIKHDFKWEITDLTLKTKSQIYGDTKEFIAETWKSAKDIIQNDDKDNGKILIKCICKVDYGISYYFGYTVKFQMKDKKYRITLDNVYFDNSIPDSYLINLEGFTSIWKDHISKKKYDIIINDLNEQLNNIVILYQLKMNKPIVTDDF